MPTMGCWNRSHVVAVRALVATAVVAGGLAFGAAPAPAQQSQCGGPQAAPPVLGVTPAQISPDGTTVVTLMGGNYLKPVKPCDGYQVFGGIYVFFGWVAPGGQWGPSWRESTSMRGHFGHTYTYPGDQGGADTRDDGSGVIRLVSFSEGGMSGTETPFHMDGNGNWTTTLTIRGATYQWLDVADGKVNSVDCRVVQCGVFTIGAHGLSSRTNEVFTPISFTSPTPAPTVAPGTGGGPVVTAPPAGVGGSGNSTPNTTARPTQRGGAPTTVVPPPGTPGATTSTAPADVLAETTVVTSTTTSTSPERSTTTERGPSRGDVAAGSDVIVLGDPDGGGPNAGAIVMGLGGLTVLAAAVTLVVQRRRVSAG